MSLSREAILAAAFEVVRRHGPAKATVVDVAEAVGVSHGSIYRFFPTKAALREAVVAVWLDQIVTGLEARRFTGSPGENLEAWFLAYFEVKRTQRDEAPELFEAFRVLSAEDPAPIQAYKTRLVAQLSRLLREGRDAGVFRPVDEEATARALLNATARFHHPHFAKHWSGPEFASEWPAVWDLLSRSISSSKELP